MMRLARRINGQDYVIASLQGVHQHIIRPQNREDKLQYGFGWLTNFKPEESVALHHRNINQIIATLTSRKLVDPRNIFLLGFSQSVGINFRFAFTHAHSLRGVIAICGGIPGDWETTEKYSGPNLDILYLGATQDEFYPPDRITQFAIVPEAEAAKLGFATGLADLAASEKIIHYRLPFQPTAIAAGSYLVSADKLDLVHAAYSTEEDNELASQRRYSAIEAIILSHLELLGPLSVSKISGRLGFGETSVTLALLALENAGSVFQFERRGEKLFVERAYYQRLLHFDRRPRNQQYRVSADQYLEFLQVWQHTAGEVLSGSASLRKVLLQLQGVALAQDDWVEALKLRISDFSERMLASSVNASA